MIKNLIRYIIICVTVLNATVLQAQTKNPQLGKDPLTAVIKAMTLEEKAGLLVGNGMYMPEVSLPGVLLKEPRGGQAKVPGIAGSTFEIPRLGIPSILMTDGTAGFNVWYNGQPRIHYATAWPTATLLASTWDTITLKKVGQVYGNEVKEYGVDIILAPAVNIHRDPRGGRNYEYFSEDPLLTGVLSAAMIEGLQSNGIGTSIKHFAANNQETNRASVNTIISERALREIYLKGFEIAIKKSHPWTVMTSYNLINDIYTPESSDLNTKILREEWGFKGFVMSDWGGGKSAVEKIKAGNNLIMPGKPEQTQQIIDAINSRALSEKEIDKNVAEILTIILQSPTFHKYKYSDNPDLEAGALASKEAAVEGIVLLKNNGNTLPFSKQIHNVALFGNGSYDLIVGGKNAVNPAFKISLSEGLARLGYTAQQMLKRLYTNYINEYDASTPVKNLIQEYMRPTPLADELEIDEKTLEKALEKADVAVISISMRTGEGTDRTPEQFYLTDKQKEVITKISTAFHSKNKKVVVVLNIAAPVDVMQWRDNVDAILFAGIPGMEGGLAIAELLTGKVNPSGKLATTIPKHYEDVSTAKNFPGKQFDAEAVVTPMGKSVPAEVIYEEGIYVGYRYFNTFGIMPAYEFGYGLSYTSFNYGSAKLNSSKFKGKITVTITITNSGSKAGKEIVQLYLKAPSNKLDKPSEELKGFAKTILLLPGKSQAITFTLKPEDLASFDTTASAWVAEAGKYTINIGASSLSIKQSVTFDLEKELIVENVHKALAPQIKINELKVNK